ncbi:MAG TPA: ABC transporter substrate-binding protein [Ureibacillus sp.]|nr:ABC transporter substrate-binding protein [Ureibacillus sp.]
MYYELELHTHFQEQTPTNTSIEELASIWQCSTRYAKTIINRLADNQVIKWEVFQGRGKKPLLTLLRSKHDAIYDVFDQLWCQEKFDRAYELLMNYQLLNHPLGEEWLMNRYGIQQVKNNKHIFRQPFHKVEVNFDPLYALSRHDFHFAEQLHETLFIFNEVTKKAEVNLLFDYETEDFQTWRLILRKGVFFHNLEPLTSADVKRSLERAIFYTNKFFTYKSIDIVNDYELLIQLTKPSSLFTNCLAANRTAILPKYHQHGKIGCGAFKYCNNTNEKLQLETFQNYFKQRPWIDTIEILYTQNVSSFTVSPVPYESTIPSKEMIYEENGADYILLNGKSGALSHSAFRETIYSLIDSVRFTVNEWGEIEANSWLIRQQFTKVQAQTLIPAEQFPTLTIGVQQIREGVNHEREAIILKAILAEYGIHSEMNIVDFNTTSDDITQQFDLFVGGAALGRDIIFSLIWIYTMPQNTILGKLPYAERQHVNGLIDKINISNDPEKMMEYLIDIETILQETFCLKFLNHRTHRQYVREDSHYKQIQFDSHGRIDYKRIYA